MDGWVQNYETNAQQTQPSWVMPWLRQGNANFSQHVKGFPPTLLFQSPTMHPWIAQMGAVGAGSKWFDKTGDVRLSCTHSFTSSTCQERAQRG